MRLRDAALGASAISAAAWIALAAFRGSFWRMPADEHREAARASGAAPDVEAVVPARDESETIGRAISSLVEQRYDGRFAVTLVDDRSDDGTAQLARAAVRGLPHERRLHVVEGGALPDGWTGKLNALQTGIDAALARRGASPDYWLFTDADIVHDRENLRALVAKARAEDLALVSLMVRLNAESRWERLLVPAFVFFFAKLYPFAWSNDRNRATAAAAGGCLLLSHAALVKMGGLAAVRGALIDDCAIARAVKIGGDAIWLGRSDRTRSVRRYATLAEFWSTIRRTAFTQLGHSYPMLGATVGGMSLLYLVPPLATIAGLARRDVALAAAGAIGWGTMSAVYAPTLRAYERPAAAAPLLPIAAGLYVLMTVDSALAHARKRGGAWKGRTYGAAVTSRARPGEPALPPLPRS